MEHSKLWDLRPKVRERRFKWTSGGNNKSQCNNKDDPPNSHQKSKSNNDARNLNSRVRTRTGNADGMGRIKLSKISCIKGLDRIRADYCELYCEGSCDNRTCNIQNRILTTEDYQMKLFFSILQFTWTNRFFGRWNIYKISNETECEILKLVVTGIPNADDIRVRSSSHYLRLLGINETIKFEINVPSIKITEDGIKYKLGAEELNFKYLNDNPVNSLVINNYIRESMNNTKKIHIIASTSVKPTFTIEKNIFEGKKDLQILLFSGLNVVGLTEETFDGLTSLDQLYIDGDLQDLKFLRSSALRSSLKYCTLKVHSAVDLKNFDHFPKLEIIVVFQYIAFNNLAAFVCFPTQNECNFTLGINGIPCPSKCHCQYSQLEMIFTIDCSQQDHSIIPALPVPIKGKTVLILQQNQLSQLPDNSLEGYNNLKYLDVSQNQLTSLSTNRLPKALDYLDISFNQITTLSQGVVTYVRNLKYFKQFGNKWIIYNDETYLIDFFWDNAKWIRIKDSEFGLVMNIMNITSKAAYLSYFFSLDDTHFYWEANEDYIINTFGESEKYFTLKLMEELNNAIWLFAGEYDEYIIHHLNEPCPYRCTCCVERRTDQFIINCANATLDYFPRLPNLIPYNTTLYLDGNDIHKLTSPQNLSNAGLASIQKLHMSGNMLAELPHHLMPENITYLDLSNNSLHTLDYEVVKFLRYRKEITEVKLSGNPWDFDCKSKTFLSFLRERDPVEYEIVMRRVNITQDRCPEECICCIDNPKSKPLSLIVDCSNKGLGQVPALPRPTIGQTTLIFERNSLREWPSGSLPGYSSVARFYLGHNLLSNIDRLPDNVNYLDISYNNFSVLSVRVRDFLQKRMNSSQLKMVLSGNPWTCNCEEKDFLEFVKEQAKNIGNASAVQCGETGKSLLEVEEIDICPSVLIYYTSFAISLLIIAVSINIFICFRQPILIWFYEHEICLSLAARRELDQDKKFDAFLSFTHKDEDLVEEFVDRLEKGRHKFRLCFYLRDWLVGESIPDCINQSVKDSKRIIILMTKNFLKSTWGRLEFRLALHATSKDRCKRLIVVLYPDVENFDDLDSELRAYMVLNTYLDRNHPNFWNKLIYSMPHIMLKEQLLRSSSNLETTL
ncbi:slit homolog 3 protein [Drosophila takahashii]|uniref:slit homolog 3 protein n=1 Tax=Drosophila takahashii TaxID=29030 RepID=UPI001CF91E25|nr:uncharacterized protein LOC108063615 [Drosophila takahashii]